MPFGEAVTNDRILPAIALRLLSAGIFAMMSLSAKLAENGGAKLGEVLFFRQGGAALLMVVVIAAGPGLKTIRSQRMGAHVFRAVVGLTAMSFTFAALMALPLAEATTISFSMPIFATILGALLLGEPTGPRRWAAVLAGFAGVLIVLQPGGGHIPLTGASYGLIGAALSAGVAILLRQLGTSERPLTTVFWFSSLSCLPLSAALAWSVQPHPPAVWLFLLATGLLGGCAQVAMTASLTMGPVSVVVPMDYTSLIWATLFGWLIFGTLPAAATAIGAPIIIASGLYIIWREHVRRREETLQASSQAPA